ncbi:hypothetical protein CBR_g23807 [Chara braunii]|uniref:Uncharacterized protein n=1 Tax=Chara braunii TaxID=69332 RepID=A0A388JVK3_CHABU|nr:hypothetical protein CBR_g23807 [Chara braunii]|eukprot:GBG61854.1 hypothetical protein CBR_g23807 [Chara braunii]
MVVLHLLLRAAVAANSEEVMPAGSYDVSCGMYGDLQDMEALSDKNFPQVASAVMSKALLRRVLDLNVSDSVALKQMSAATLTSDEDLQSIESRLRAIRVPSIKSDENVSSTGDGVGGLMADETGNVQRVSYLKDLADRSRAWLLRWGLESIVRLGDVDAAAQSITSPKHIDEVLEVGNALCQLNSNQTHFEDEILGEHNNTGLRVAACFFTFRGAARQIEVLVSLTRSATGDLKASEANLTSALHGVNGVQPASTHVDLLRRVISDMAWNGTAVQEPTSIINARRGGIGANVGIVPRVGINQTTGEESQGGMLSETSSGNGTAQQQDHKEDQKEGQFPVSCVGPSCERLSSKPNTRSLETALWLVSGVLSAVVFCTIASVIIHRVHRAARSRRRPPGLTDFSRPGFGTSSRLGSANEEGFTAPFNPLHSNSAATGDEPVRLEVESELGEASYGFAGTNSPYSLGIPRGIWIGVGGFGSCSRGVRLVGNNSRVVAAVVQPDGLAALAYMQPKRVEHKRSLSGVSDISSENDLSPKAP